MCHFLPSRPRRSTIIPVAPLCTSTQTSTPPSICAVHLFARLESQHRFPQHTVYPAYIIAAPVFLRTLQRGHVTCTSSRPLDVLLPPSPGARISRGRFLEFCLVESALKCVRIADTFHEWGRSTGRTACGHDDDISKIPQIYSLEAVFASAG